MLFVHLDPTSQRTVANAVSVNLRRVWSSANIKGRAVFACVDSATASAFKWTWMLHLGSLDVVVRVYNPKSWTEADPCRAEEGAATRGVKPTVLFVQLGKLGCGWSMLCLRVGSGRWSGITICTRGSVKGVWWSRASCHDVRRRQRETGRARSTKCCEHDRSSGWRGAAVYLLVRFSGSHAQGMRSFRECRVCVLPEFQGLSQSSLVSDAMGQMLLARGIKLHAVHASWTVAQHRRQSRSKWVDLDSVESKARRTCPLGGTRRRGK